MRQEMEYYIIMMYLPMETIINNAIILLLRKNIINIKMYRINYENNK